MIVFLPVRRHCAPTDIKFKRNLHFQEIIIINVVCSIRGAPLAIELWRAIYSICSFHPTREKWISSNKDLDIELDLDASINIENHILEYASLKSFAFKIQILYFEERFCDNKHFISRKNWNLAPPQLRSRKTLFEERMVLCCCNFAGQNRPPFYHSRNLMIYLARAELKTSNAFSPVWYCLKRNLRCIWQLRQRNKSPGIQDMYIQCVAFAAPGENGLILNVRLAH